MNVADDLRPFPFATADGGAAWRRLAVLLALIVCVAVFETGPMLFGIDDADVRWFANPGFLLFALVATVACHSAAGASEASDRAAWRWLMLGHLSWLVGMAIWSYNELLVGDPTPFPAASDVFWFLTPPFLMLGMLLYRSGRTSRDLILLQLNNIGIVLAALMATVPMMLHDSIRDELEASGGLTLYVAAAVAWPVLYGTAFIFGLICLGFHARGGRQPVFLLLLVSFGFHAFASLLYAQALLDETYEIGADLDLLWIIALASVSWAAFEQRELALRARHTEQEALPSERLRAAENIIPGVALCLVAVVHTSVGQDAEAIFGAAYADALLMILGVVVALRGWFSLRIEAGLRQEAEGATAALEASDARHRAFFEHSRDGILLSGGNGQIVAANPAAGRMLGWRADELSGRPLGTVASDAAPSDEGAAHAAHREILLLRKDGSVFPAEIAYARFRDADGRTISSLSIRDITWRKEVEAAIATQSALLRATLDSIPQGVAVYGEDLRLAARNEAFVRLLNLPAPLAEPDTHFSDLVRFKAARGDLGPGDVESIVAARLARATDPLVEDRTLPDGATVEAQITPMPGGGFVATYTDVSERKRVERLKNEFVSTVSHELRTPLTSMAGSLGLVIGGAMGPVPPRLKPLLEIAHNNCNRLQRLINDILDIEKIESAKMDLDMQPLALPMLIEQAVEANRAYAAGCGVSIEIAQPVAEVTVTGDFDRLLQVFANLLSNAAKFSPSGAAVVVATEVRNDRIRVLVSDRGPGIPASFRSRIFERFAQADAADDRSKGGTGLGLSIAKAIVETHGGQIGYETEEGRGTTFHFDLPLADMPAAEPLPISALRQVLVLSGGGAVEWIGNEIRSLELEAVVAGTIAEAEARVAERGACTALVVDLTHAPDPLDLIHSIRARPALKDLPIIAVTSAWDAAASEGAHEVIRIVDWLVEPLDPEALKRAVSRATANAVGALPHVLHVEDDFDNRQIVAIALRDVAQIDAAATLDEARRHLAERPVDMVILDLMLPDGFGTELLPVLDALPGPPVPIVIFSAFEVPGDITRRVAASLVKSRTSTDRLRDVVRSMLIGPAVVSSAGITAKA